MILTLLCEDEQMLSLPLPFWRKREVMVHTSAGGNAAPWPQQEPGASPAPCSWASWSAMPQWVCFPFYTWCPAAQGQGCHVKSLRSAYLLAAQSRGRGRGRGSGITWGLGRNARSPASPRPPESGCGTARPSGVLCTSQLEKRCLKLRGSLVSGTHRTGHGPEPADGSLRTCRV